MIESQQWTKSISMMNTTFTIECSLFNAIDLLVDGSRSPHRSDWIIKFINWISFDSEENKWNEIKNGNERQNRISFIVSHKDEISEHEIFDARTWFPV